MLRSSTTSGGVPANGAARKSILAGKPAAAEPRVNGNTSTISRSSATNKTSSATAVATTKIGSATAFTATSLRNAPTSSTVKPTSRLATTTAPTPRSSGLPPKLTKTASSVSMTSSASSSSVFGGLAGTGTRWESMSSLSASTNNSTTRPNSIPSKWGSTSSRTGSSSTVMNSKSAGSSKTSGIQVPKRPEKFVVPGHVKGEIDLSLMISKNNPTPSDLTPQECAAMLKTATHIRLDRSNLENLSGIIEYTSITHLHIQHNYISSLAPLASLLNLRILCAAGNLISHLDGICNLTELKLLDISKNLIQDIEIEQFPASLENLVISENPCTVAPDYRLELIYGLNELTVLDEVDVGQEERRLAKMRFGNDQEKLDAIMWKPTERENDYKVEIEEIIENKAGLVFPANNEVDSNNESNNDSLAERTIGLSIDLEPFKITVDGILERSRIRQAENMIENRARMDELIAQVRASGKARTDRLKEVLASLE
ncbi:UNVERIFIED_CONTAM: hypothetical protein HDU68_008895 [Siphonaria sp. JEL0065]|nr:hypothetical protein HDU68_008895 [Siphonaria sp. JEL0065]